MRKDRTTTWDNNSTPMRTGVYQRKHLGRVSWAFWDGEYWHIPVPIYELSKSIGISANQRPFWRGLVNKPTQSS